MLFPSPLQPATLIKRYKRFLADVELPDGSVTTLHCPNTGSMKNCGTPGDTVWYSTSNNPKRKYPFTWELTEDQAGHLICVNTARANQVVDEALRQGLIPELCDYRSIQREVRYGEENSRIDFFLSQGKKPDAYVEVKSVTLLEHGQGYFPDAVTTRGQKHLRELIAMRERGSRAVLLFAVMHTGIQSVIPAVHIDSRYAELFAQATAAGVEIVELTVMIGPNEMTPSISPRC